MLHIRSICFGKNKTPKSRMMSKNIANRIGRFLKSEKSTKWAQKGTKRPQIPKKRRRKKNKNQRDPICCRKKKPLRERAKSNRARNPSFWVPFGSFWDPFGSMWSPRGAKLNQKGIQKGVQKRTFFWAPVLIQNGHQKGSDFIRSFR